MDLSSDSRQTEAVSSGQCKLCLKQQARYTCPRCNVPYCSMDCYKCEGHASCSEMFYRDCFMEGLKDMEAPQDKAKVLEMLKRVHDQNQDIDSLENDPELDSDDDPDELDLADRLKGLDLDKDTDAAWSRLTDEEKADFEEMMKDGRLGELVTVWTPWWMAEEKGSLVTEIKGDVSENSKSHISTASPTSETASLDAMLKQKSPSESIKYNLVNIIYGYAYITRQYNGEHLVDPVESSQFLLYMCPALGTKTYTSVTEAVHESINALTDQARAVYVCEEYTVSIVEDAERILSGPAPSEPLGFVMRALSDLQDLFIQATTQLSQALKALKDENKGTKTTDGKVSKQKSLESTKAARKACFNVTKKIEFLLAWCKKHGCLLQPLLPEIRLLQAEMDFHLQHHKITGDLLHNMMQKSAKDSSKSLVEEINTT